MKNKILLIGIFILLLSNFVNAEYYTYEEHFNRNNTNNVNLNSPEWINWYEIPQYGEISGYTPYAQSIYIEDERLVVQDIESYLQSNKDYFIQGIVGVFNDTNLNEYGDGNISFDFREEQTATGTAWWGGIIFGEDIHLAEAEKIFSYDLYTWYAIANPWSDVPERGLPYVNLEFPRLSTDTKVKLKGCGNNTIYELDLGFKWTGRWVEDIIFSFNPSNDTLKMWINGTNYGEYTDCNFYNYNGYPSKINSLMVYYGSNNKEMFQYVNFTMDNLSININSTPEVLLDLKTNLINNTKNYNDTSLNLYYNGSFTFEHTDIVNVSFYLNDVFNTTKTNINLSNNNLFEIDLPEFSGILNISFNVSNHEIEKESGYYYYNIDNIFPKILTSFENNSFFNPLEEILLDVNFTDENLYAYNITIKNLNGDIQENIFAENLSTTYAENITSRYAIYEGLYFIDLEVWDSHTKKDIKNYKIEKINNKYKINDKIIFIENNNDDIIFTKKKDRYEFELERGFDLRIECNDVREVDSKFQHHYICWEDKKWIDFETDEDIELEIIKTKNSINIKDNSKGNKKDKIKFKSIGDLNYLLQTYKYTIEEETVLTSGSGNYTEIATSVNNINNTFQITLYISLMVFAIIILMFNRYVVFKILNLALTLYVISKFWVLQEFILVYLCIIIMMSEFIDIFGNTETSD